jgi:hypothetical protein
MLARIGLVLAFVFAAATPVFAQSQGCGSLPFEPALPTPAEIGQKTPADAHTALHDAFTDVKNWQADLKTYRGCQDGQETAAKRDLAQADPNKDKDKITKLKDQIAQIDHAYDASVDSEEKVVNEFHAAQAAYCMRTDVDRSVCPK